MPRRRWPRPLLALGYAVAVLLGFSASAVPAPLVLQPMWQLPGKDVVVAGEVAFVIAGSGPPVVTAVDLRSGEQLWRQERWAPTGAIGVAFADLGSGLVAMTAHSSIPVEDPVTEVVEAATGAVLHTLPGRMFAAAPQHRQPGVSIFDLASSEVKDTVLGEFRLDRPGRRFLVLVFQRPLHRTDVYTITAQGRLSLAAVVGPARYCQAAGNVLSCATEVNGVERITAWQLPF